MSKAEMIAKAAAELDKLVGKFFWLTADWRSRIDLDNFNMYDSKKCILGQLQGDYDLARSDIRVYQPDFNFTPFNGYAPEWKEYLKGEVPAVDQVWTDKNKCCDYTVKAVLKIDGMDYVACKDQYSNIITMRVSELKNLGWTLKPKYDFKAGDLLTFSKSQGNLFIYLDETKVLRLNYSGGLSGHSGMEYYVRNGGEPKKVGAAPSLTKVSEYIK